MNRDVSSNTLNLGHQLKRLRQERGLSQRELARRAGVTHASISLIESNQSSPSVASLKKVLDGLPISLADFFALPSPQEDQVFFRAEELLPLTRGAISFRQVGNMQHHQLQLLHEHYAPGADTGSSMLQHEAEEAGLVIQGEIELTVGEQKRVLKAGDAYLFDSRLPHRFRNKSQEECILVSACTPPYL
ncbi:cupin domain-containing protein [Marinospirillum perlucidum]|uniref:cupin domain-containing protein n=1 Tax=Marinospirillum perlucidum TaxID=1982602 RepID=UPI000DF14524|nr:cupin domain-containing protein [Marinospirillum perlucidum]